MGSNESKMENVIRTLLENSRKQGNEYFLFGNVYVYVRDNLPENVSLEEAFQFIYSKIPQHLFSEVEAVYVGDFDELRERQVQSVYKDGTIYVTNMQSNTMDMIEDIVHELSHSLEEPYGMFIYGDARISSEFIGKRIRLRDILEGYDFETDKMDFENPEFDKDFDEYLHKEVGYPVLINLTLGLYNSPYAATSLREYWASGFEEYILGDRETIKSISPVLFEKIEEIVLDG